MVDMRVVDWFTKQKLKEISTNKIWQDIKDGMRNSTDIADLTENVWGVLRDSDELKHICADSRLPVCSLFHHLKNVTGIAVCIARANGYDDIHSLRIAAMLHDIGKIDPDGFGNEIERVESAERTLNDLFSDIDCIDEITKQNIIRIATHHHFEEDYGKYRVDRNRMDELIVAKADYVASASDRVYEVYIASDTMSEDVSRDRNDIDVEIVSKDVIFPHVVRFNDNAGTKKECHFFNVDIFNPVLGRKGFSDKCTATIRYDNRFGGTEQPVVYYDPIVKGGLTKYLGKEYQIDGSIGLLALDVQGIQGFIKDAVKLHTLRGGSSIIEDVQQQAEKIIANRVCPEAVLFSGGGNLLAFVPAKEDIKNEIVKEIENKIKALSAGGLRCAIVCDDKNYPLNDVAGNFDEVLKDIFKKLEEKKNEPILEDSTGITESDEVCGWCFKRKITHKVLVVDMHGKQQVCSVKIVDGTDTKLRGGAVIIEEDSVCEVCKKKFVKGKTEGKKVGNRYIEDALAAYKNGLRLQRSESLEGIGNNIAVIAIDGNMMGRLFVQTMTPAEYNYKSEIFDKRLKSILQKVITDFSRNNKDLVIHKHKDVNYLGIEPLYVGGDDILLITNSKIALQFSKELLDAVAKEFAFSTDAIPEIPDYKTPVVTLSIGIAMAYHKFPIYFVMEAAENQLKMAKRAFRAKMGLNDLKLHQLPDGAISFTSITSSMPSERKHTFVFPEDDASFGTVLEYTAYVHDKKWRSTLSHIINLDTDYESRLNVIKYLYARMNDKDVFEEISKNTGRSTLELCEDVSKILRKEDIRTALQSAVPMIWHEGD